VLNRQLSTDDWNTLTKENIMGYTTTFEGVIHVEPPLNEQEVSYLQRFSESRRMNRRNGPYFIDPEDENRGIWDVAEDVIDHNEPPRGQPGLWCGWTVSNDGKYVLWDGGEKFYYSAKWMKYLIDHFLMHRALGMGASELEGFTFNHTLNGTIEAQGEEASDRWLLIVEDNVVKVVPATFSYNPEKVQVI
jgi:hypothetical protein